MRFAYALMLALFAAPVFAQPSSTHLVCFYSPETNINHYTSLKIEFDSYLATLGHYRFQPFANRTAFERFIMDKKSNVFVVSSAHYNQMAKSLPVHAELVGISAGKTTYRETLSAKKGFNSLLALSGKKIAVSTDKSHAVQLLTDIFGESQREVINSIHILKVPKDIDALMAVNFGMASAALTTGRSITLLKSMNMNQYQMLQSLGVSKEMLLSVVASTQDLDMEDTKLIKSLEHMGDAAQGRKKLNMLGLDGFRKLTVAELKSLNP